MVEILSSGHQLLLCLEVVSILVEKYSPVVGKILLPLYFLKEVLWMCDARLPTFTFECAVGARYATCVTSRHSLFCYITGCSSMFGWLPALQYATFSQTHESLIDLL